MLGPTTRNWCGCGQGHLAKTPATRRGLSFHFEAGLLIQLGSRDNKIHALDESMKHTTVGTISGSRDNYKFLNKTSD